VAACSIFESMDYETALHAVHKDLLLNLAERVPDRKVRLPTLAVDFLVTRVAFVCSIPCKRQL
jgi:hypothetical protein